MNPFVRVIVAVYVVVPPRYTDWVDGDTATEKSPAVAGFVTVTVTVAEWTRLPLVAVAVTV